VTGNLGPISSCDPILSVLSSRYGPQRELGVCARALAESNSTTKPIDSNPRIERERPIVRAEIPISRRQGLRRNPAFHTRRARHVIPPSGEVTAARANRNWPQLAEAAKTANGLFRMYRHANHSPAPHGSSPLLAPRLRGAPRARRASSSSSVPTMRNFQRLTMCVNPSWMSRACERNARRGGRPVRFAVPLGDASHFRVCFLLLLKPLVLGLLGLRRGRGRDAHVLPFLFVVVPAVKHELAPAIPCASSNCSTIPCACRAALSVSAYRKTWSRCC